MLVQLTTVQGVVIIANMKSIELLRQRIVYSENQFAELVLWQVVEPVVKSKHLFKYRLAYVVKGLCVLRYDNEAGKGDHRHWNDREFEYKFTSPEKLLSDFQKDIERWNHENGYS